MQEGDTGTQLTGKHRGRSAPSSSWEASDASSCRTSCWLWPCPHLSLCSWPPGCRNKVLKCRVCGPSFRQQGGWGGPLACLAPGSATWARFPWGGCRPFGLEPPGLRSPRGAARAGAWRVCRAMAVNVSFQPCCSVRPICAGSRLFSSRARGEGTLGHLAPSFHLGKKGASPPRAFPSSLGHSGCVLRSGSACVQGSVRNRE